MWGDSGYDYEYRHDYDHYYDYNLLHWLQVESASSEDVDRAWLIMIIMIIMM